METKNPEKARSIKLVVNGKEISLNPFTTHMLGNTIWSMISSLKLEEKPERIVIEVSQ